MSFLRGKPRGGVLTAASVLFLAAISPAHGQQQPQQPAQPQSPQSTAQAPSPAPAQAPLGKISAQSNLVTVYATVRDKKGQFVKDLKKDDFALDEDGHPQAISYFARENDLSLTVGLLVDTSLSQRRVLDQERSASYTFLDHMLGDNGDKKDRAFVIHFDFEVELLQELTSSRPKLQAALQSLETPRPELVSQQSGGGSSGGGGHGGGGGHHGGGTLLYDAVFLASDEVMRKEQGRKAVIVLSDGVDHGSQESLESAIRAAQRANTIVYSILFKDDEAYSQHAGYSGGHGGWGGGGGGGYGGHHGGGQRYPQEDHPDGKKVLDRISRETGGRLFVVSKKEPVDQIYSEIEQELRNQYILGYPPEKSESGGYHKIHLTTKQKDLVVQARDGYYSEP
jgi:VWFA-related protein